MCVPVTTTALPRGRGRRERFIVWNDTVVEGVRGASKRDLLQEAFQRSKLRHAAIRSGQRLPNLNTNCIGCGRNRMVEWCRNCTRWHHRRCVTAPCTTEHQPGERQQTGRLDSFRCRRSTRIEGPGAVLQAGDGSVELANTPSASGSWAIQLRDGTKLEGQILIHREDITSTRCEIHALLAGLAVGPDSGAQICDNHSAIQIFNKVRDFVRQVYVSIRYGDPHRMEMRSLMEHMDRDGTLQPQWVRSHQEQQITDNLDLRTKRLALAQVDMAAKVSHHVTMPESYADWIRVDAWCLCDEENRIVMGNTLRYLMKRTRTDRE